jgi:hypothetical protein
MLMRLQLRLQEKMFMRLWLRRLRLQPNYVASQLFEKKKVIAGTGTVYFYDFNFVDMN